MAKDACDLETRAPIIPILHQSGYQSALEDEDDEDEDEALATDHVFVAGEMIGSDVPVAMKAKTESHAKSQRR